MDAERLMQVPLRWVPDPQRLPIMLAEHEGRHLELRVNPEFPDVPMYTLSLGDDEYVDLEDLPPAWERGRLQWPDDADRVPYHMDLDTL